MEEAERAEPHPRLEERPTVLVVEDDEDLRAVVSAILGDAGFHVEEAEHGREALERIAEGVRPCLVLLDLKMPVMGGREVLLIRRRIPALTRIPFVVTTAYPQLLEERPLGTAVLRKPFHVDELIAVVRRLCGAP